MRNTRLQVDTKFIKSFFRIFTSRTTKDSIR
ncbi:hypothetical protein L916_05386 [Phytophthora nicotianae]|uniref:Uncharacterized protein n=1 Tax=Phytophthora nicotianae TaxID=4792 RepID=W2JCZ6_PHYNI|nr:hypothetical protein L916_05386 [Phytophthora nicotianae]